MRKRGKIKILMVGVYLLLFLGNVYSQPQILTNIRNIPSSETYLLSSWNSNQGLPQNTINSIGQDSNGYIWLATFGGLVRFDGVNFKVFSAKEYPKLSSDRITKIFIDKNNLIFIANESGKLLTFDGKKIVDITSKFPNNPISFSFLGEDSKAYKYILADSLLYYYSQGKAKLIEFRENNLPIKVSRNICSSPQLINDTLFIIRDEIKALLYNGKIVNQIKQQTREDITNSCVVNSQGYWFLRDEKLKFAKTFKELKNAITLFPNKKFITIYGKGDELIASTWERELVSIKNFKMTKIQERNRKLISLYGKLFIDKKYNYWVGSEVDGLFYIKKKLLYTLDKTFGINRLNTYPIFKASDNTIWIGQNYGLQRIVNKKIEDFSIEGISSLAVWGITEDKDKNIWIATNGNGIFKYNGKNITSYMNEVKPEAGLNFFTAFRDKNNSLWFGGIGKLVVYNNAKFKYYEPIKNKANIYRNIIQDKRGVLWIVSDDGLLKFENNEFVSISVLNLNSARTVYIDKKDRLWIGTYGKGIAILTNGKFQYLTEKEGLFSNIVSAIVEDKKGNFWFSSNNGLFRIRESEIDSYLSGGKNEVISIHYGIEDGLTNNEFNGSCQPNWMRDDEGNLWFPSFGGAVVVDIKSLNDTETEPIAFIENFVVDDYSFSVNDKIEIPSGYNNLTIYFNSPSFSSPKNVKYHYRLLGSSDKWRDNNNVGQITFQKLPYGKYEFQLLVIDSHGNQSKKPVSIKFTIKSVFYETPFFYIIAFVLIISLISILYFVRLRLARINEMKLEALVKERTLSLQNEKENAERSAEEERIHRAKAEEENRQKIELL
ncbi:MAG: two-component regulator propeller domain-containing protein, partial [Melioribacteraceae bacterium]